MKVAVDSGPLTGGHAVRGVGVYTRELTQELKKLRTKEIKIEVVDFGKVDLSRYDLVHYPYFHPFFLTLPFNKPAKAVVTIHDLIPLIYPKNYPPGLKGRLKYLIQKRLVRNVDGIIAPSETSKKDIVRFLGFDTRKIRVIYEAPRKVFRKLDVRDQRLVKIKKKYNLPEKFVLYVGDVNYNKNILGLAKACKIVKVALVIVGKQAADEGIDLSHPENQSFAEFLEKYGDDSKIKRLGFVPDKELVAIYDLASVYCQPSFYEGFGLSVLEAMACETPVVCSKTQALVEIAGEAALFANPKNPKDLAKKLSEVIKSPRTKEHLIKKGKERAVNFTWKKTARETIEFYKLVNDQ